MTEKSPKLTHKLQQRLIVWLSALDETLPWWSGLELTGLTLKKDEDGWLCVLKVRKEEQPYVAFFYGPEMWSCLYNLALTIKHNRLQLKHDKYR